ncbi:MAG: Fe-S cluster protein, partial [Deltaproteobacteria bacterium]|nr:Fe-S cluster protein [Deltaproteobacteria bacterium]
LKHLPKTNCKKCKAPTCMVFAAQLAEGAKNVKDCPELSEDNARKLENYLKKFLFVRETT